MQSGSSLFSAPPFFCPLSHPRVSALFAVSFFSFSSLVRFVVAAFGCGSGRAMSSAPSAFRTFFASFLCFGDCPPDVRNHEQPLEREQHTAIRARRTGRSKGLEIFHHEFFPISL